MLDAKDGFFQLQVRTQKALGSSNGTVFSAGVAQEANASKVEVRLNSGGKC